MGFGYRVVVVVADDVIDPAIIDDRPFATAVELAFTDRDPVGVASAGGRVQVRSVDQPDAGRHAGRDVAIRNRDDLGLVHDDPILPAFDEAVTQNPLGSSLVVDTEA